MSLFPNKPGSLRGFLKWYTFSELFAYYPENTTDGKRIFYEHTLGIELNRLGIPVANVSVAYDVADVDSFVVRVFFRACWV